jgi:hypothetical protein
VAGLDCSNKNERLRLDRVAIRDARAATSKARGNNALLESWVEHVLVVFANHFDSIDPVVVVMDCLGSSEQLFEGLRGLANSNDLAAVMAVAVASVLLRLLFL